MTTQEINQTALTLAWSSDGEAARLAGQAIALAAQGRPWKALYILTKAKEAM